jgi:hypothetical protein
MEKNNETIEILTLKEFAGRMKLSRTTVFDWMRKGILKAGRHYIKMGRVIRFEWGQDLLNKLHEDSQCLIDPESDCYSPSPIKPVQPLLTQRKSSTRAQIDLGY